MGAHRNYGGTCVLLHVAVERMKFAGLKLQQKRSQNCKYSDIVNKLLNNQKQPYETTIQIKLKNLRDSIDLCLAAQTFCSMTPQIAKSSGLRSGEFECQMFFVRNPRRLASHHSIVFFLP
ncbi:hypothetical protein L596_013752 [Steinernema carpocapsae]|uniref:Uncharacterized protein n=1 Tax=Steinernema carpocapsae TaxID=34508 RepID=A0A4U5P137_STECR|nr:hypothetical protein L596_013752 [Steinernema carpocapsae]